MKTIVWVYIKCYESDKKQLLTPKLWQPLQAIINPLDTIGVMLKQSRSVLHLGFFDIGLNNAITLDISVSILLAAWVLSLMATLTAGLVTSAGGETTPRTITSSLSALGEEWSVVGDWKGRKEGWVQSFASVEVTIWWRDGMERWEMNYEEWQYLL